MFFLLVEVQLLFMFVVFQVFLSFHRPTRVIVFLLLQA